MKIIKYFFVLLTLTYVSGLAQSNEIIILDKIRADINAESTKARRIIPIDKEKHDQNRLLFRTWVSESIDLEKASKRESVRFNRTSYIQEVTLEAIRLPSERFELVKTKKPKKWWRFWKKTEFKITPKLQLDKIKKLELKSPIMLLFRAGPSYFKFEKLNEIRAEKVLTESQAVELAKDFLEKNLFVIETEKDVMGLIEVEETRINEDAGEGKEPDDYLIQQDVVFGRKFDDKPVLNSQIVVGFLPDNRDIALFEHFDWTPLVEKKEERLSRKKLESLGLFSRDDIITRLEEKIRKISTKFIRAEVTQVIPAWYQTDESLIPVLGFEIEIEFPSQKGPFIQDYFEVMNLVGSDEVFFKDYLVGERPSKAKR